METPEPSPAHALRRLAALSQDDTPLGGAGGAVVDVLLMLLPLVFLVTVTISRRLYMPTSHSVPLAAAALYLFKLCYLGTPANPVSACVLQGMLLGLVPLSILFGAFCFFNALTLTQCTAYLGELITRLCGGHPVAEVFLIVWGLGHLIEGASGFGTPGALLPAIAAGLGHDPFHCVVALLIATTTVGPFGSSGIGIWFGLSALNWPRADLVRASFLVSLAMALMSYPIGVMSARFLLSWEDLRRCWLFVVLSITSGAVPALSVALFSYEVPALVSGVAAVLVTGLLARYRVGLRDDVPSMLARARTPPAQPQLPQPPQQQLEQQEQLSQEQRQHLDVLGQPEQQGGQPEEEVAIQIELAAPRGPGGTSTLAAAARGGRPVTPAEEGTPRWDARPSFATLRSRTVSSEAGGAGAAGPQPAAAVPADPALALLSALHGSSPRRRSSQQQQLLRLEAGGPGSPDASVSVSPVDTSASAEVLLPAGHSRSRSAPTFSDVLRLSSAAGAKEAGAKAGAAGGRSLVQLHASAGLAAGPAGSTGQHWPPGASSGGAAMPPGAHTHLRLVPWVAMLVVVAATRVPYLQKSNGQELTIPLGSLCDLRISSNLVITVADILRAGISWSYALLYVPSLLPFVATGSLTLLLLRGNIPPGSRWTEPYAKSWAKCRGVVTAMLSALVLVALMIQGGRQSPAFIIGYNLSSWLHQAYVLVSLVLGGVGSFFSGSAATSNMAFGTLQQAAAARLGLPGPPMLMLQIVGGAAGQMISIANILGARAALGLQHIPEGRFVSAALPACLLYYVVGTALGAIFLFAG